MPTLTEFELDTHIENLRRQLLEQIQKRDEANANINRCEGALLFAQGVKDQWKAAAVAAVTGPAKRSRKAPTPITEGKK